MPRQVISVAKYGSDDRPHTERERESGEDQGKVKSSTPQTHVNMQKNYMHKALTRVPRSQSGLSTK